MRPQSARPQSAQRAAPWITRALSAAALLTVAAWLAGRIVGERIEPAQVAAWVPTELPAVLAGTAALLALAWAAAVRRRAGTLARAAALAAIALGAWVLLGEWGAWRWLSTPGPAQQAALRVLSWNASNSDLRRMEEALTPINADLALIVNAHHMARFRHAMADASAVAFVDSWPFHVVSNLPVRRWGAATLGLQDLAADDPGRALFVELAQPEGGTIVVWVVDMPSDVRAPRGEMFRRAAEALQTWQGPAWVIDDVGARQPVQASGFPAPDLVVGDLNTPRWSRWIEPLAPRSSLRDAISAAAVGPTATYPRKRPLLPIDAVFVGRAWGVRSARTLDMGDGTHRAVVCDLLPPRDAADTESPVLSPHE